MSPRECPLCHGRNIYSLGDTRSRAREEGRTVRRVKRCRDCGYTEATREVWESTLRDIVAEATR